MQSSRLAQKAFNVFFKPSLALRLKNTETFPPLLGDKPSHLG